ncbi:MAG: DUF58 domain-containing protein, partial [Planctomycetota bacterium]
MSEDDLIQDEVFAPELMARVRQIQLRTRRMVSEVLTGAYRSTFRGSGIEFDDIRPYQPGDDVRSIDWKRTARAGDAYIKTYIEERELSLVFAVDTSRSMDFGSREFTKREVAAQLVALLSYVAARQHDRVGLALFGAQAGLWLPPRKGADAVARVIREVLHSGISPGRVRSDEAKSLTKNRRLWRPRLREQWSITSAKDRSPEV